jgi:hypothetical protein
MRYFELLNIQHFVMYLFPAALTVVLIAIALSFGYIDRKHSNDRLTRIIHRYPLGIEERNAPFPLILILVILGTVIWGFGYIFMYGLSGMNI